MIAVPESFNRGYYGQIYFGVKLKVKYGDQMVNQHVTHRSHYLVIFTIPWTEGEISAGIISDALVWTIRIFKTERKKEMLENVF